MSSEPPVKRAFVFIDGQNLFHTAGVRSGPETKLLATIPSRLEVTT